MKYRVCATVSASGTVDVEADSKEEAIQVAMEEGFPTLCAQCSGYGRTYSLELGWATP